VTVNRLLRLFQYLQKKFRKLSGAEEKSMKLFPEILVAVPVLATVLATAYVVYRNGVQPFPEKDLLS